MINDHLVGWLTNLDDGYMRYTSHWNQDLCFKIFGSVCFIFSPGLARTPRIQAFALPSAQPNAIEGREMGWYMFFLWSKTFGFLEIFGTWPAGMEIQKLKCKYLIPGDKYNRISVPLIQSPLAQAKQSRSLLGIITMFSCRARQTNIVCIFECWDEICWWF